jgi:hypothetical protein
LADLVEFTPSRGFRYRRVEYVAGETVRVREGLAGLFVLTGLGTSPAVDADGQPSAAAEPG